MRTAEQAKEWYPEHDSEIQERAEKLIGVAMDKLPKYLPELEAWEQSDVVQAAEAHKKAMMESPEMKRVMYDAHHVQDSAENHVYEWGQEFKADWSYAEWMSNESLPHLFEDLYQVKEDIKALVMSKAAQD